MGIGRVPGNVLLEELRIRDLVLELVLPAGGLCGCDLGLPAERPRGCFKGSATAG